MNAVPFYRRFVGRVLAKEEDGRRSSENISEKADVQLKTDVRHLDLA
jgi:hypothetical protein